MKRILVLLVLGLMSSALRAEVMTSLYEVKVPVAQRGEAELTGAVVEGLNTVLVRVSGRTDIGQFDPIRQAMRQARAMLLQYRYDREYEDGEEQLLLALSFSEQEVNRLLLQSGLPVWDKNRPQTLVWLVVDDVSGRQFVSEETHPEIVSALREAAALRGLPLVFPVLDIDDRLQLTIDQIWTMDVEAVRRAAERYRTSHILSGRVTRLSRSWLGNFVYVSADDESFVDRQAEDLADIIAPTLHSVADELGNRYAVMRTAGGVADANIVVSGVRDFRDYARLLTYLEGVAVIEHANPVWIDGAQLIVRLHLQGSMEKAQQFFQLDKKLMEDENPGMAFSDAQLSMDQIHSFYRWQNRP
ncbi:hypothetical protein FHR99_001996 [Litorivivens lipolytica]|uniref:DUF2066 domain-containing protein n=1 Tax=Litorivivens lipolytica TaxID=1524264 RepID=A0A7W4W5I2_9GAMM|nr:DUF2066 domain-containing protein [Litorivivens lipolytica]MBB3047730.1 hypothetical protein [Litorivivens lipolytica]